MVKKEVGIIIPGQGVKVGERSPTSEEQLDQALDNYDRLRLIHPNLNITRILGNSYGIYAALVIGGILGYFAVRELVRKREELVHRSEEVSRYPTGMVSIIGMDQQGVSDLITSPNREISLINQAAGGEVMPEILITNDNGPLAKVIGGPRVKLGPIVEQLGRKAQWLATEGAYHHPVRIKDSIKFAEDLKRTLVNRPEVEFISSTKARILRSAEDIIRELQEMMTEPVNLPDSARLLVGLPVIIDNGPGEAMKKLLSRILSGIPILSVERDGDEIRELK